MVRLDCGDAALGVWLALVGWRGVCLLEGTYYSVLGRTFRTSHAVEAVGCDARVVNFVVNIEIKIWPLLC